MNYRQFFTQAAIKAVEFSQYIAQRRGKGYIGTGQLLLGILHMRDTIAATALDKFGVDYDSAEQVIRASDGFRMSCTLLRKFRTIRGVPSVSCRGRLIPHAKSVPL